MARVKYLRRADSPNQAIFDRLERERKVPTANIFLALTQTPELLDGFITYANALRSSPLSPRLRELAILTVGHLTKSRYEIAHHQSHGLKAGLTQAQLDAVPQFESSPLYDAQEKAVMAFARESTLKVEVDPETWRDVAAFLSEPELIALVLVVAWYNSGVRIMAGLDIELEESHR
ncbi:carboxymuconolactone decarboxylase family protein [Variovorax soli]|jgi:alkylhydroperoxidase family enzyme|uniref:Alkylhydroperoxidase family enzyme n=1 Tax=Variovorax soli TaxID=376815 RepID=A0ABU1NDQ2_9BURK|nr:carboxymuconolactone decarboxylase family protein [Variovorax soli]MDR6536422.1 alkylhydroperoxidase family enzyme [Variovorax soli]